MTSTAARARARHLVATEELTTIGTLRKRSADIGQLRDLVLRSLDDDQAEDIVTIDLQGKTAIADYMVIANGRSSRQVGAMADHLLRRLKDGGFGTANVEGLPRGDWVLIDAGDIIIHLFRPEVRDFYNLEKMWSMHMPEERVVV